MLSQWNCAGNVGMCALLQYVWLKRKKLSMLACNNKWGRRTARVLIFSSRRAPAQPARVSWSLFREEPIVVGLLVRNV